MKQYYPYLPSLRYYRAYVARRLRGEVLSVPAEAPNRGLIRGAWGEQILTVPIEGGRRKLLHTPYEALRLSWHDDWPHNHFHALTSAYGALPYFPYFADAWEQIYARPGERLAELTERMHLLFMQQSGLEEHLRWLEEHPERVPAGRLCDIPEEIAGIELLLRKGKETLFYLL